MNNTKERLLVGQAKIDITPQINISAIGHGEVFFTGLKDRLFATALVFAQGKEKVCLMTLDLCSVEGGLSSEVKKRVANMTGIKKNNILLCASHTHRGPNTSWPSVKNNNIRYIEELTAKLVILADNADKNLTAASIGSAIGKAEIGINRRLLIDGEIAFMPNPKGVYDKEVMIVSIKNGNKLQGLITSHACHATNEPKMVISADYPGEVRTLLHNEYGTAPVISYLAGCCGDVRPNGPYKKTGWNTPARSNQIEAYSKSVISAMKNIVYDKSPTLKFIHADLILPLDTERLSLKKLQAMYDDTAKIVANGQEASSVRSLKTMQKTIALKKAKTAVRPIKMEVAILQIGNIMFVFLPGEVFTEIGTQIKALAPDKMIIPVSFYNHFCPYICTAKACAEGGFEPNGSFPWHGPAFPFPFAAQCEKIIVNKVAELFRQLENN